MRWVGRRHGTHGAAPPGVGCSVVPGVAAEPRRAALGGSAALGLVAATRRAQRGLAEHTVGPELAAATRRAQRGLAGDAVGPELAAATRRAAAQPGLAEATRLGVGPGLVEATRSGCESGLGLAAQRSAAAGLAACHCCANWPGLGDLPLVVREIQLGPDETWPVLCARGTAAGAPGGVLRSDRAAAIVREVEPARGFGLR